MKRMIIIGAGVSGLSAGCYAAMNGFDVKILEMHSQPGGVCASWKRKEYLFDHCLHWVIGSNKGNPMYPLFEELGVMEKVEFYHTERFRRIKCAGKDITVYTDIGRLEEELIKNFPDEDKQLKKMMRQVRFFTRFKPPMDADFGSFGILQILKMLPFMPLFLKLKSMTVSQYMERFGDPVLRDVLLRMFPVGEMPALMIIMPLAFFHNHEGGYPLGGSLNFAKAIEERFISLGGSIEYRTKAKRIVVSDGRAAGVETQDGSFYEADAVVSACDARYTLFELLGGEYTPKQWKEMFDKPEPVWPPLVCLSLGVNRDLSGEVELQAFKPDAPVNVCGQSLAWIYYCHYCHDPAFAPRGKSVVEVQFETDFDYWKALRSDEAAYQKEKRDVFEKITQALESQLPGITNQIEAADIATPVTWERYTANWKGSYQGWLPTVKLFGKLMPKTLPGLKRFYITGQWTFPGGGVPMCMSQARRLIKGICADEHRPFKAALNNAKD